MTEIEVGQGDRVSRPAHVSKGSGFVLGPGDWVQVRTPGGGGWGDPSERDPAAIRRDVERGLVAPDEAAAGYGHAGQGASARVGERSAEPVPQRGGEHGTKHGKA
jgi:N-methylhydantoinase B/oxoprolinase/acetone carboxylase alpha subunit